MILLVDGIAVCPYDRSCVLLNAEWKPKTGNVSRRLPSAAAAAPQTMQSSSTSGATCTESSSRDSVTATTKRLRNCSVQAGSMDTGRLTRCTVSVADVAVEVGESLLASGSQMHDRSLSTAICSTAIAALIQKTPVFTMSVTDGTTGPLLEPAMHRAEFDCQGAVSHQQTQHTASVQHRHGDDAHESSAIIVVVSDEEAPTEYHLSCDDLSSCEKSSAEETGPLDCLAQPQVSLCDEPVVLNTVSC